MDTWTPGHPTIETLQLDGFKVVICETCHGWERIPHTCHGSGEYSEEPCPTCKGTGRQIARTTTKYEPFELPKGSEQ